MSLSRVRSLYTVSQRARTLATKAEPVSASAGANGQSVAWTRRLACAAGLTGGGTLAWYLSPAALADSPVLASEPPQTETAAESKELPLPRVLVLDLDQYGITEDRRFAEPSELKTLLALRRPHAKWLQLSELVNALEHAGMDDQVHGLVASIGDGDSPMKLAQLQELRDAIFKFRELKKDQVPTVAYSNGFYDTVTGATLGYYLASAFEQIYVSPSGLVHLSGLAEETPFMGRLLDNWRVQPYIRMKEEYKNVLDQFTHRGYTKPHREAIHGWLSSCMQQIVSDVAVDRGLTVKQVQALSDSIGTTSHKPLSTIDMEEYILEIKKAKEKALEKDGQTSSSRFGPRPAIAIIPVIGEVMSGRDHLVPGMPVANSKDVCTELRIASEHPDVKAVVLRIDSPGGDCASDAMICQEVKRLRECGKPVVASMGNLAASSGYSIAAEADKIVAQPGTLTGSIGVVACTFNIAPTLKLLGIDMETVSVGKHALFDSWFTGLSKSEKCCVDGIVDRAYDNFIKQVAERRNMDYEQVRNIAKGRIWTGADAHQLGLVDELGGLTKAVALAKRLANIPEEGKAMQNPQEPTAQTSGTGVPPLPKLPVTSVR